jgi:hypothetical protein
MCVLQRQTAGHKSVRNQKVLWPAHCIEGLGLFCDSSSKRSVGAHITRFTTCLACGPTCWYQNLVQIQHALQSSLSRCILKTVQFPSLPNPLLCPKPTFSRTSGHCVGTCRATKMPCHIPSHTSTKQHKHLRADRTVCYLLPATTLLRPGSWGGRVN